MTSLGACWSSSDDRQGQAPLVGLLPLRKGWTPELHPLFTPTSSKREEPGEGGREGGGECNGHSAGQVCCKTEMYTMGQLIKADTTLKFTVIKCNKRRVQSAGFTPPPLMELLGVPAWADLLRFLCYWKVLTYHTHQESCCIPGFWDSATSSCLYQFGSSTKEVCHKWFEWHGTSSEHQLPRVEAYRE